MSQRKSTAKGGRKNKTESSRTDIEERARAILADTGRYDYDTRHTVHVALSSVESHRPGGKMEQYIPAAEVAVELPRTERELRALVERAEAGEPVGFVWNDPELKKYAQAARRVLALMYSEGVPDFISDGLYKTLMATEAVFGAKLWRIEIDSYVESGGWSIDGMAHSFRSHQGLAFEMERRRDLAELLEAALKHPDMPAELYNAIHDGLNELTFGGNVEPPSIHHIRWCLSGSGGQKGGKR